MNPETDLSQDDPRLLGAAQEYLRELESGRAPDRSAYLRRHPELAAALAELLDGVEMAHAAGLALRPATPTGPEVVLGTLGDFLLLGEIGRGGMGVVYEAIQISLGRRVALKVLSFAAALDERHLQRFRAEANAAAGLHHTNIVPVHAVGCDRGVHFYAMQLIDGRPLDVLIRELRGEADPAPGGDSTVDLLRAAPTTPASPTTGSRASARYREGYRSTARLIAQAADALDYAHEAGVVHRDIKPANLLLDRRGTLWVTDFGLAQVADVNLTRTGDVVGTLRYMSPEQASGRRVLIDHRTDVYSLGATLYELLTLRPPFPAQDRAALLNQILHDEPQPPRQIDGAIPAELETIVLKATAKAPEERYATAGEMAADLRRFLDELPIHARRPTLAERGRKWLRRHPLFLGATATLLAFAVAVLATAVALVWRAQTRTQDAYAEERKRAREAEDRFRLAQRAVDDLIRVAQEELIDRPQTEQIRKRLLESALTYYQEFIVLAGDDPEARADLAVGRDRVEEIVRELTVRQGDDRSFLLKDDAVLDDLRLSSEERPGVEALRERLEARRRTAFGEFHRLQPDERERRSSEMRRANNSDLEESLSPARIRRLAQIELQRRGPDAFRDADIAAALKLTTAQRTRVRVILADLRHGEPGRQRRPPNDRKRETATKQIAGLLTPTQTARWKAMFGDPFKGQLSRPGGPKGPPRRGRPPFDIETPKR